ncbi:MAG: acetylxylan esterase [Bacteroidota bacterium]
MKQTLFLLVFLTITIPCSFSQNRLSPIWKYSKTDNIKTAEGSVSESWPEVNLMLSWERQGLCWIDKDLVLKNYFFADKKDTLLELSFSLQGDVQAVYINQKQVSRSIPNSFWSERDKKQVVIIPDSVLHKNARNEIIILINNLSYTGGLSHNSCSIRDIRETTGNSISLDIPKVDHVYLASDKRSFTITAMNNEDTRVRLVISSDFHRTVLNKSFVMKAGKTEQIIDLEALKLPPGFYECVAISEGKTYCGDVEWIAVQPEDIPCPAGKPVGFDDYWQSALKELRTTEPDFSLKKVDSLCSSFRDGYVVEMTSLNNLVIRGYYFVPKKAGKHPAILQLPGYGYGFQDTEGFVSREDDVAELALCVRGHGISRDVFNPWDTMTLWAVGACNRDEYIYRSIYMDCVRAVEFLKSRPEIDGTRIGVMGGSQGGGLAIATAGLCQKDIAVLGIFDPWLCDFRDQAAIRTMINRELEFFSNYPTVQCDAQQIFSVLDFADTKYFAADITCPVRFTASLFDDDCPVHDGFSVYNNLKTNRQYFVYPNDSHLAESGQYSALYDMLKGLLLDMQENHPR